MVNQGEDANIKKAFDDVRDFHLPAIPELPLEKPREELLLEQEKERGEIINGQKKQFPAISSIPAHIFLSRGESGEDESSPGLQQTAFKEDAESYKTVKPTYGTAFEQLHAPRSFVYRTSQFRQSFEWNSDSLYYFMDQHDIARVPNAMKRIKKGESVNLHLPRYSAKQIKERIDSGQDDLFGYLALLPYSLTKSSKSSYQRKMIILHKFQEMMRDCDYTNRTGYQERKALNDIQKKLSELQVFIDTPRPQPSARSASVPAREIKQSAPVALKIRNNFNYASDSEPVVPRKIERESRPSTSSTENRDTIADARLIPKRLSDEDDLVLGKTQKVHRNVDPSVEREKIDRAQRTAQTMRREAEYLEKQKREKEENDRKQAAAREENERRRLETEKQRAEEFAQRQRQKEERRKIADEHRMNQEREQKRLEEEQKRRETAEEFESLKQKMQEVTQETRAKVSWSILAVRMPPNWSELKDKYFNHYKWSTDAAQRELERRRGPRVAPGFVIPIPHANNDQTKVYLLTLPKIPVASKSSSSVSSEPFKKPGPVVPVYRKGDEKHLEKLIQDIKKLTEHSRRNIASYVSLTERQVNYQDFYLHKLKSSFTYPFGVSDGFYWPLIFVLEDSSNLGHVRSLAVCNSFSGKYASRYLLTTPLQEDSATKKFNANFHHCSGDWMQYSQKPGRFSKRLGYRAHYSKSKDSFDVQKQRARDKLNNDYDNERREQDEFGRYMEEYRHRGGNRNNDYKRHITTHLRQLIKDARLDVYSLKESDQDANYENLTHPGTRESLVPLHWHSHGYNRYLTTRDREFGHFMHKACARYEDLLESRTSSNVGQFNEWCFTPMLASLHYQSKYAPYDVFSSREMRELNERYKRYHGLLRERKFPLKEAIKVCKLTKFDKMQWTILHDQLVSHFRDFPAVFHIMYNKNEKMITKVDKIVNRLMDTEFRDRSNGWLLSARAQSNSRYF